METCDEQSIICSSFSVDSVGKTNNVTIYTGSCQGFVQQHKSRWCYHKSLEMNICCGIEASDCCVVATTKVVFSSIGSSLSILVFLFFIPFILHALQNLIHTMSVTAARCHPKPEKVSSKYSPHSSAAVATMKQKQYKKHKTNEAISSTRPMSCPVPDTSNIGIASYKWNDPHIDSNPKTMPVPETSLFLVTKNPPTSLEKQHTTISNSDIVRATNTTSTLAFPDAISPEESKIELD